MDGVQSVTHVTPTTPPPVENTPKAPETREAPPEKSPSGESYIIDITG